MDGHNPKINTSLACTVRIYTIDLTNKNLFPTKSLVVQLAQWHLLVSPTDVQVSNSSSPNYRIIQKII